MFGIGIPELILILVVALILLGPQKLPEVAKSLGRGMRELKRASDDLRETFVDDYKTFLDDEKKNEGGQAGAAAAASAVAGAAEGQREAPAGAIPKLDQLGTAQSPGQVIDPVDPEDCGDAYEAARREDAEMLAAQAPPAAGPGTLGAADHTGWPAPPSPPASPLGAGSPATGPSGPGGGKPAA
jgi:sec-independent protein translocase protein TatA